MKNLFTATTYNRTFLGVFNLSNKMLSGIAKNVGVGITTPYRRKNGLHSISCLKFPVRRNSYLFPVAMTPDSKLIVLGSTFMMWLMTISSILLSRYWITGYRTTTINSYLECATHFTCTGYGGGNFNAYMSFRMICVDQTTDECRCAILLRQPLCKLTDPYGVEVLVCLDRSRTKTLNRSACNGERLLRLWWHSAFYAKAFKNIFFPILSVFDVFWPLVRK